MPQKVTWKKGMRLSMDVFNAMDSYYEGCIRMASQIASGGRYGLFPTNSPFELSVDISGNVLEVVSLNCRGITKSGKLIDIDFDSNYTATFDTRVAIPSTNNAESFLLVVKLHGNELREVSDLYSEQAYSFVLLGINSPLDNDSLPIGCLVNQFGWRMDETDFVPPCLYINAHHKYQALLERAKSVFKAISDLCLKSGKYVARHLIGSTWTTAVSEYITLDKESQTLTPGQLYAAVQKMVSSFVIGCTVDEYFDIKNPEPFVSYIQKPLDARHLYTDIKQGVELCEEISLKMEDVCKLKEVMETPQEKSKPAPKPVSEPEPASRHSKSYIEI